MKVPSNPFAPPIQFHMQIKLPKHPFAAGVNFTGNGKILANPLMVLLDPEAFFFTAKHESAHIFYEDQLKKCALDLGCSAAFPNFLKSFVSPLTNLAISLIAKKILLSWVERRAEWSADDQAIKKASNEELLAGIRLYVAFRFEGIIRANSFLELLNSPQLIDKQFASISARTTLFASHPSIDNRLEAFKVECVRRGIFVPEKLEIDQLALLIALGQFNDSCKLYMDTNSKELLVDFDELAIYAIKKILNKYPELLSTGPLRLERDIELKDDALIPQAPVLNPIAEFDTRSVGNDLLAAYRHELTTSKLDSKKNYVARAVKLLFNLATGATSFVDDKGENITVYLIQPQDFITLSDQARRKETIKKISKQWSLAPLTRCITANFNKKISEAVVRYYDKKFIQNLMQKHAIRYIANNQTKPGEVLVGYTFETNPRAADAQTKNFENEFFLTICKLAALNGKLTVKTPKASQRRWSDEIKKNSLWLEGATVFFPKVMVFFNELSSKNVEPMIQETNETNLGSLREIPFQ